MHVAQYQVLVSVNHLRLIVRFLAPQHEDHASCLLIDRADHIVCKLLPTFLLVAITLALLNCQNGIEEEDTLLGPSSEIAVDRLRHLEIDLFIVH